MNFDGENTANLPQPVGWRLLVGKMQKQAKTTGGIILPDEVQKYMNNGLSIVKVLAKGDLCYDDVKFRGTQSNKAIKHWVNVGDVVVIGQFVGQTLDVFNEAGDSETLKFLNDDEVIAVISDLTKVVV